MSILLNPAESVSRLDDFRFHTAVRSTLKFMPVPSRACFSSPEYHIWCGSMVRDAEGVCHLFYSRWPKILGFNAWVTHSEVARATAMNALGPYIHQAVVLSERGNNFWDGLCTHNPTVLRHEEKYYLYYMGNTGDRRCVEGTDDATALNYSHRNNQRIGVAVADHPSGPWTRFDQPLIDVSSDPGASDSLMIANPAVTACPDGGFLMIYKAVGHMHELPFGGPVVHRVALSRHPLGPFIKQPEPVFTAKGRRFPAEDPYVWTENGQYRAILKDMNGTFTSAGRSLALFKSKDGLHWTTEDPCLVSNREVSFEGGSVKRFDYLERPQLYFENGHPNVLFCAAKDGEATCNLHIPLASEHQAKGGR